MIKRENQLKVKLSDDEVRKLQELAQRDGVSVSDVVRGFIRDAHRRAREESARLAAVAPNVLEKTDPIARRTLRQAAAQGARS